MRWTERRDEELDFRLDQLKQGRKADEIDKLLVQKRELARRQKGKESEQTVIEALKPLPFVADVIKANRQDDRQGTDLWVLFNPESKHQNIPIQVKSSWAGFDKFVTHKGERERIIIIVVTPERSTSTIRRIFLAKLRGFDGFI